MKFGNTLFLFLLPLWVTLGLSMVVWGQRRRSRHLKQMVAQRLSPLLLSNYSTGRQNLKNLLFLGAIAFIGFALAAPKWGHRQEERYVKGVDLLIAVDVSKSMLAEDIKPNRLERTKLTILDLLKSFSGHRVGLIAFAGNSFLQCPLTLDHNAFVQSLNAIDTDTIPLPGTAINAAIELAEKVYDQTQNQKLLFLFSDGEELADSAIEGARQAKKQNICIYTIGIGSTEGTTILIADPTTGKISPLCDRNGQVVKTSLDEKTLQEVAEMTDGQYYHLSPAALSHLQKDILTRFPFIRETANKYTEKVYQERYQLFLFLGFLLLLLEMLMGNYKRPEQYSVSIYYKLSSFLLVFLFALNSLSAKESQGEIYYKNKEFEKALEFYNQQLKKKPEDRELLYNKGTTCLALKQYEEAIDYLKKSASDAPIALQKKAFYNLGNTLFEQGQGSPEPQKTLEKWKESLRHFQSTVDLDGQFEEAKKNTKYVEEAIRKLEEQQRSKNQQQSNEPNNRQQNSDDRQNSDQQKDSNGQQNSDDQRNEDNRQHSDQQQNPDDRQNSDQQDSNGQQNSDDQRNEDNRQHSNQQQNPDDRQNSDRQKDPNGQQNSDDQRKSKKQSPNQRLPDNRNKPKNSEYRQSTAPDISQDQKMSTSDALQILDALENEEKKLLLEKTYGNIRNRNPEKFW
ncbi:MAG: VWA domain-containing protein [Puniceicoccales bacterium]|nr:VWA domain-containing protein [Puniceicoccales bacterium]